MSDDMGPLSNYQSNRITSNKPKPGAQPTNIIVNNTAIVHMPVKIWKKNGESDSGYSIAYRELN